MSDNYTPSMADLREAYVLAQTRDGLRTEGVIAAARADANRAIAAHDAELREQIAQEIEVHMRRHDNAQIGFSAVGDAYAHAARIARGQEQA